MVGAGWTERRYGPALARQTQVLIRRYGVCAVELVRKQQVETVRLRATIEDVDIAIAIRADRQPQVAADLQSRLIDARLNLPAIVALAVDIIQRSDRIDT